MKGASLYSDAKWERWVSRVESVLAQVGIDSLDGDQAEDGYSLDCALDAFNEGQTPERYADDVMFGLGFRWAEPDGEALLRYEP